MFIGRVTEKCRSKLYFIKKTAGTHSNVICTKFKWLSSFVASLWTKPKGWSIINFVTSEQTTYP